ncbi:MAG TPA: tRNA lysidine(34) synthetase TilS [Gemmatimonadaceae bacterium]|nr:tRNA lysidine(34) synthetase TilS [Gemmatimonadaceae bacterium]
MSPSLADSIFGGVAASLAPHDRIVLAVSGGLDSMALLDAAAAVMERERLLIATYDHGTGAAARDACALVQREAAARGTECVVGRARGPLPGSEAAWRDARWSFLREVARASRATIATAHTADDQIETVLMRIMRGAGPRGMAALLARGEVLRPLLDVRRSTLLNFAAARGVEWVEDPTNASRRFLRNRIRHDLLPALRRVNPLIDDELLDLGRRAAEWRLETDSAADVISRVDPVARTADVRLAAIRGLDAGQVAVLWPAVAARIGVTLDRRGISRAASFSSRSRVGARIQVSGGWEIVRSRHALRLRSTPGRRETDETLLDLSSETRWGGWTFWSASGSGRASSTPSGQLEWNARLPIDQPLRVREWRPGDRLIGGAGGTGRKVKRLLNDAGVTGHERQGWPVVLSGDRIVWIPGVRRSDAATARSAGARGQPILTFSCARNGG